MTSSPRIYTLGVILSVLFFLCLTICRCYFVTRVCHILFPWSHVDDRVDLDSWHDLFIRTIVQVRTYNIAYIQHV